MAQGQSALRLSEIGPRMELEVIKEEDGLCAGAVLFHAFVEKSEQEANETQVRRGTVK